MIVDGAEIADPVETDAAPPRETHTLVIVDRDTTCAGCGHPIYAGDEAARWIGVTIAHVACAVDGELATRGGA